MRPPYQTLTWIVSFAPWSRWKGINFPCSAQRRRIILWGCSGLLIKPLRRCTVSVSNKRPRSSMVKLSFKSDWNRPLYPFFMWSSMCVISVTHCWGVRTRVRILRKQEGFMSVEYMYFETTVRSLIYKLPAWCCWILSWTQFGLSLSSCLWLVLCFEKHNYQTYELWQSLYVCVWNVWPSSTHRNPSMMRTWESRTPKGPGTPSETRKRRGNACQRNSSSSLGLENMPHPEDEHTPFIYRTRRVITPLVV